MNSLTFNCPITSDLWDKIADADFDATSEIRIQKKNGDLAVFVRRESFNQGWISVTDRLPPIRSVRYLVVAEATEEGPLKGYQSIEFARCDSSGAWHIPDVEMGYKVTHWQHLPMFPEA